MLIPYKAQNPIRRFPVATASVIALNVIVYCLTTQYLLGIRPEIVKAYGCQVGVTPFYTFFTAMFLHQEPFHLLGNMLFLWVFGPSVEDRLGIGKYLGLYFITGFLGDLLQAGVTVMFAQPNLPGIGASGCIMGVVGAYWYLFSWSPILVFYWIGWFWHGVWEVAAFWIIGLFVLMDVFEGSLDTATGMSGGVANFAHIGGALAGILICLLLKIPRDSGEVSEAKAMYADSRDIFELPLVALKPMLANEPQNPEILRAVMQAAARNGEHDSIRSAVQNAGMGILESDPLLVAWYLIDLKGDSGLYRSIHLLRLAGAVERQGDPGRAEQIYDFIVSSRGKDPESEAALYRLAVLSWNRHRDAGRAGEYVNELRRRYPYGEMVAYGDRLLKQIAAASK